MRRILALLLMVSLTACSDDPVVNPDAGTSEPVDAGTEEPRPDAGNPKPDAGSKSTVGFGQLEGPAQRSLLTGASTEIGVLVYVEGLTDADGAGAGVEVEVGYGAAGALPSTFQFSPASYAGDADGLGPKANDRFTSTLTPPAGIWDVAARIRCETCEPQEVLVDLNWSQPDYDSADAIKVTVAEPSLGWCSLVSPHSAQRQLGRGGGLEVTGQVFAQGLTEASGAAAQLTGELGIGPANTDPRTTKAWSWSASQFTSQQGNNDEHKATLKLASTGTFAYAYRFHLGEQTIYCDIDGNDGSPDGFALEAMGALTVAEPFVDFAQLEGNAAVTVGAGGTLTVTGVVHATGITGGAGAGADIAVQFGYGDADSDPATHASWTWTAATYKEDADGLAAGDKANDRYAGALQLPAGTWDVAMRATLLNGPHVVADRDGTANGYAAAQAIEVTVIQPKVDWCKLNGPQAATGQLGRMQPVNVAAQVWSQGLTDVTSGAAPAGLEGELGFGAAGTDPDSAAGWTWTSAAFRSDAGNDDVFDGEVSPAALGDYALAFRFRIGAGAWHLCDLDGNDGSSGGFDPSGLGALSVTPPRVDFAQLEGPQLRTGHGAPQEFFVQVYASGITEGAGQGQGVEVEFGFGDRNSDPETDASWTWIQSTYMNDADGLTPGDLANDRYFEVLAPPDGSYDLLARVRLNGGPFVYVDLDGTDNGFDQSQAIQFEVFIPKINWCVLSSPLSASYPENSGGSVEVFGEVYGRGLTDQAGQQTTITGELGFGPASGDPATDWTWAPTTFVGKAGTANNNDRHKASIAPTAAGTYGYAYRFRHDGGPFVYCDSDGNDVGAANGFDKTKAGTLTVVPPGIGYAGLEGPATRTVTENTAVKVGAVIYMAGVTDAVGQGPGIVVELGRGERDSDPATHASWSWGPAVWTHDYDGLAPGDNANDRYEGEVALPDGLYDLAMRVSFNGGAFVYVDLDGTSNGYAPAFAVKLTVSSPKVSFCRLNGPTSGDYQHQRGAFTSNGEVYAAGITGANTGAGITGEVGYGMRGTDPRSAQWTWVPGAYLTENFNNDLFRATFAPPASGQYAFTWRFKVSSGSTWFYCDTDGNDGTAGGFDLAKLGALDVNSPWVDYAALEGQQQRTLPTRGTATVSLLVYADGITPGAGQGANVTVEVGYGNTATAPSTDPSWRWSSASYKADVDGLSAGDKANDRYEGSFTPPDGNFDAAARVKLWSGEWVYVDLNGTDSGYESAQAIKLAVNPPPSIAWAQLRASSDVENVGAKLLLSGEAWAAGITDAAGQGAGITAELGIGPRGTDPRSAAGWTWSAASYLSDAPGGGTQSNDVYGGWLTAPAAGQYSLAMRFTLGSTVTYADRDAGTAFATAELAPLETFAAGTDVPYCKVQDPKSITVQKGADFEVFAEFWIGGVTDTSGSAAGGISSQVAVGPDGSDPRSAEGWSWRAAAPNPGWNFGGSNDEHRGTLTAPQVTGIYRYGFRIRRDAGWTYCDNDFGNSAFAPAELSTLTVP